MDFINSLDFIAIGFIICIFYEAVNGIFNMRSYVQRQMASMGGGVEYKKDEFKSYNKINTGSCILGLFYIFFVIKLFWTDYWLIALLLVILGMITGSVTNSVGKKWKDAIIEKRHEVGYASAMNVSDMEIDRYETAVMSSWSIDKALSIALMCWGLYLHLQTLGIIG